MDPAIEPGVVDEWAESDRWLGKRLRKFCAVSDAWFRTADEDAAGHGPPRPRARRNAGRAGRSRRTPCSSCCMARWRCAGPPMPSRFAELRAGELVGEIGFFANVPRTANVIAIRDTSVLVLTRAAYQELAQDTPAIAEALLAALALRFAQTDRTHADDPHLADGPNGGADRWRKRADSGRLLSADARGARQHRRRDRRSCPRRARCFPGGRWMPPEVTDWLNELEQIGAAGDLSRRAAKRRPGRARPSARPTWSCSRAAARPLRQA